MPRLVPLDAEPTTRFVDDLRRTWDAGDAVLPVDPRLPAVARRRVLEAARVDEPVEPGDALVVATSGTTGEPKGVVLTHAALAAGAEATSRRLGVDRHRDRWLACLPLAHIGGLGVVVRALLTDTPLVVRAALEPAAVSGATLVSIVRAHVVRDAAAVGSYRVALVGGGPPPPSLPPNAVTTYGATETGGGVVYDGRPLDGVEVRAGEDGELRVRGPMLLRTLRSGPPPFDEDGWLRTGDAGRVDDDGRVHVDGRIGDVIVSGGEKVWPEAVERVLRGVAGVADVAVVGRADAEWGERVVAVVVPGDRVDPPDLDALRAAVRRDLPPWCAPKELVLVDVLPRTALGKVRRSDVRASLPAG